MALRNRERWNDAVEGAVAPGQRCAAPTCGKRQLIR